jgi:hypothetical protein
MPHIADQTATISTQQTVENEAVYADLPPLEAPVGSSPPKPWTEEELTVWRAEAAVWEESTKNAWPNGWPTLPDHTVFYTYVRDNGEKSGEYGLFTEKEDGTVVQLSGNDLVNSVTKYAHCRVALIPQPSAPEIVGTTDIYYFSMCPGQPAVNYKSRIFTLNGSLPDEPQSDCIWKARISVVNECKGPTNPPLELTFLKIAVPIAVGSLIGICAIARCRKINEERENQGYRAIPQDAAPASPGCLSRISTCCASFFSGRSQSIPAASPPALPAPPEGRVDVTRTITVQ